MTFYYQDELECAREIKPKEESLIDQIVYMEKGDRGLFCKLDGMRMLFPHRSCDLKPGLVIVDQLILKEKYGFILGRNISPKVELTDEFFLERINIGAKSFCTRQIGDASVPFYYKEMDECFCIFDTSDNKEYKYFDPVSHPIKVLSEFSVFKQKHFIQEIYAFSHHSTYIGKSIFKVNLLDSLYIPYRDAKAVDNIMASYKSEFEFHFISPLYTDRINREMIENIRNYNTKRIKHIKDVVMKNIAKNFPRDLYEYLGVILKKVNDFIEIHGIEL